MIDADTYEDPPTRVDEVLVTLVQHVAELNRLAELALDVTAEKNARRRPSPVAQRRIKKR